MQEGHQHGLAKRRHALALAGLAIVRDLQGVNRNALWSASWPVRRSAPVGSSRRSSRCRHSERPQARSVHQIAGGLRIYSGLRRMPSWSFDRRAGHRSICFLTCDSRCSAVLRGERERQYRLCSRRVFLVVQIWREYSAASVSVSRQQSTMCLARAHLAAGNAAHAEEKDDEHRQPGWSTCGRRGRGSAPGIRAGR